jgi:dolichol-phosphate mannosyltransferase
VERDASRRADETPRAASRRAIARALVTIPTYNEIGTIESLSLAVLRQDPRLEVLVVDDGSPDGTGDRVEALGCSEPRLHLLRRSHKAGLGTAYLAGFHYGLESGYDVVFTMDGDGSHDPGVLPAMLAALSDCDMVIGSRYIPGGGIANWKLHRRILSLFANWYTRKLLRIPQRDCTSGYRGYRCETLRAVDPFDTHASGYSFLEELVWKVHSRGFRVIEVPIVFVDRHMGMTKIELSEIVKAAWHVLQNARR